MAGLNRAKAAVSGLAVAVLYGLAGCAQPPASGPQAAVTTAPAAAPAATSASPTQPAAPVVQEQRSLVFYDSDVFDLGFADALKTGADQVHVNFAGPTSLNSFPARMNVWLAEVKKSEGNVTVMDPAHTGATRGLFGIGIIFDLIDAINTMHARREQADRLALVHPYDAKILYDSTTGMAREVDFVKRLPPAPAGGGAPATGPAPTTTGN